MRIAQMRAPVYIFILVFICSIVIYASHRTIFVSPTERMQSKESAAKEPSEGSRTIEKVDTKVENDKELKDLPNEELISFRGSGGEVRGTQTGDGDNSGVAEVNDPDMPDEAGDNYDGVLDTESSEELRDGGEPGENLYIGEEEQGNDEDSGPAGNLDIAKEKGDGQPLEALNGAATTGKEKAAETPLKHEKDSDVTKEDERNSGPKETDNNANRTISDNFIPHIIHQIWKSEYVPVSMSDWITSWSRNHANWTHVLWTPESIKNLIAISFPDYLPTYNEYKSELARADAARYFILHQFGGVYADLDLESLKSLEGSIISKHKCILTEESASVSLILHNRLDPFTGNTFMACQKHHSLFQRLVQKLPEYSKNPNILHATGPFYLDEVSREYQKQDVPEKELYIAPSEYFLPTVSEDSTELLRKGCQLERNGTSNSTSELFLKQKHECKRLISVDFVSQPGETSYTNHHWVHSYLQPEKYTGKNDEFHEHYKIFVPGALMGSEFFQKYGKTS